MTVQNVKRLAVIDGETLMDARLPKRSFCVETLLPEGISMLGGAPKVGKSWMVLLLALQVAKGEPLWNLPTKQGTVLYHCVKINIKIFKQHFKMIPKEYRKSFIYIPFEP